LLITVGGWEPNETSDIDDDIDCGRPTISFISTHCGRKKLFKFNEINTLLAFKSAKCRAFIYLENNSETKMRAGGGAMKIF